MLTRTSQGGNGFLGGTGMRRHFHRFSCGFLVNNLLGNDMDFYWPIQPQDSRRQVLRSLSWPANPIDQMTLSQQPAFDQALKGLAHEGRLLVSQGE